MLMKSRQEKSMEVALVLLLILIIVQGILLLNKIVELDYINIIQYIEGSPFKYPLILLVINSIVLMLLKIYYKKSFDKKIDAFKSLEDKEKTELMTLFCVWIMTIAGATILVLQGQKLIEITDNMILKIYMKLIPFGLGLLLILITVLLIVTYISFLSKHKNECNKR